jgi:hypothetical protein
MNLEGRKRGHKERRGDESRGRERFSSYKENCK